MIVVCLLALCGIIAQAQQSGYTLVEGGRTEILSAPRARVIVPSRMERLREQKREVPNVIFAPVEGRRIFTKANFINANSRESSDEALKIYDHFISTRGRSILAQVADPFYVTQPPERTTVATLTPDDMIHSMKETIEAPTPTTTVIPVTAQVHESFTTAAVRAGQLHHHNITQLHHHPLPRQAHRQFRREERFPADTRLIVPHARHISANPISNAGLQSDAPVSTAALQRTQSGSMTLIAPSPSQVIQQSSPFPSSSFPPQSPQLSTVPVFASQSPLQNQPQPATQLAFIGPPLVGFPQAVQSPYRSQFGGAPQFVPDTRTADEIAWANYLAARGAAATQPGFRMPRFRPAGGSFAQNRRPTAPIPLPNEIDFVTDEGELMSIPPTPFEVDTQDGRRIPVTSFSIDDPSPESFEKPSQRLRSFMTRYPHMAQTPIFSRYDSQQPPPPQQYWVQQPYPDQTNVQQPHQERQSFEQQQQQQLQFYQPGQSLEQQQQQQLQQQQFQQPGQFTPLQRNQKPQFLGYQPTVLETFHPSTFTRTTMPPATQHSTQSPYLGPVSNTFYSGPVPVRREISSPHQLEKTPFTIVDGPQQQFATPSPFPPPQPQFPHHQQQSQFRPPQLVHGGQQPQQQHHQQGGIQQNFQPPQPPPQPQTAPQPLPNTAFISRPRSALSPNQKLDTCCRKQGVNPLCQNLCNFDSFNDKTLVGAFVTGQCPGDQLGKAFDCASTKADHNECCMRGGLATFLGGKCLPFCNTHKNTPANVLDYIPCLQVFRVIRDCFRDYQEINPNIFGD